MRATMLHTYDARERVVTPDMEIRHVVFFENNNSNLFIAYSDFYLSDDIDIDFGYTPQGLVMQEWLEENAPGKYSIQSNYIFFEDRDDALLCYLRYKG